MKRFSVISAVHVYNEETYKELLRAIESVAKQTFDLDKVQYIIVNDGSTFAFHIPKYPFIKIINQENLQRYEAYNHGFREAKGEIFTLLDGDDEYDPDYLKKVDKWFKKYPNKIFNFGCKYYHLDGEIAYRDAFEPKKEKKGHEVFGGGNIVWGTFAFHRSVYDKLGAFPPLLVKNVDCSSINYGKVRDLNTMSPYDFSAYAQIEFPEIRKYFMVDHENEPNKIIKELGNPFGQDFYLFYKYTRIYHSKPIHEEYLYGVHPAK
jgi:glycosyltransferase involved in cell wall biosynthesis